MSKQQTAVDWLVKEIYRDLVYDNNVKWLIDQAKQMEKEQIVDAFHSKKIINTISAEQYYRETYGGDHE
jgi:hypothetical protein